MEELFKDFPDVVTVAELQKMLHIGRVLAYNLVKSGSIKSRKIGRDYKIAKSDVKAYLSSEVPENRNEQQSAT